MAHAFDARVEEVRVPAPDHVEIFLRHEALAQAIPGQFAHVLTPGTLRRPISFSRIMPERHVAGILFRVVGQGTAWLSRVEPGQTLNLLAPLGRGFTPPDPDEPWCVVGGGVGIPPLYAATRQWGDRHAPAVILGARTRQDVLMADEFQPMAESLTITTDDGSWGTAGTVLGPLDHWLTSHPKGTLLACGPTGMLAEIWRRTAGWSGRVQLALEQRMGCGIGACLACVVTAEPVGPEGPRYRRVCTEGPVFAREELVFQ